MGNNNLHVCRKLIFRQMKTYKKQNLLLVFTILLICMVYTLLFLFQKGEERAYFFKYQQTFGSESQIVYRNLTEVQAEALLQQENVKKSVRLQPLGRLGGEILEYRQPYLAAVNDAYAKTVFCAPTEGRMPKKAGEIALDTMTLDSLGLPHKLGTEFEVLWTKEGEEVVQEAVFTLCGFWNGQPFKGETYAWITEKTAEGLSPGYRENIQENEILGVDVYQTDKLEEKAVSMAQKAGISEEQVFVNLAYNQVNQEKTEEKLRSYVIFALFAFGAGFLMLHSIFLVSAEDREQQMAAMKALGMTPRQSMRFLLEHAFWLCAAGVPLGCLGAGWIFQNFGNKILEILISTNPGLSAFSFLPVAKGGVLALFTVIAAVLYDNWRLFFKTPTEIFAEREKKRQRKRKSWKTVSIGRMAWLSVGEVKGSFFACMLLLFLSSFFLCSVFIRYISYDVDYYLKEVAASDYTVADASCASRNQRYNEAAGGISEEMVENLRQLPGVEKFGETLSHEVQLTADEALYQTITDFYHGPCDYDPDISRKESMEGDPDWIAGIEKFEKEKTYTSVLYGTEGYGLEFMTMPHYLLDGAFDAEKYASGDYVIAVGASAAAWISAAPAGSKIQIEDKTFTVMMTVQDPAMFPMGSNSKEAAFSLNYLMPPQALRDLYPHLSVRQINFNVEESQKAAVEKILKNYEAEGKIAVERREETEQAFAQETFLSISVQLVTGLFLFLIAVLSYGNLLMNRMMLRKRIFALYQGLGMDLPGVRRMVLYEGLIYGAGSILAVFPAVALLLWYGMPLYYESDAAYIHSIDWAVTYEFSLLPLFVTGGVLLLISLLLPQLCLMGMEKKSITERLRNIE